jgi:four helix bundle protein
MHRVAMHDFKRLRVWQEARVLGVAAHRLSRSFPRSDRQVVAAQLRRAAMAIAANIAEGCGKSSRAETIRFLQVAAGSATETENHLIQAADLGFISTKAKEELSAQAVCIQRMLESLCRNLPP